MLVQFFLVKGKNDQPENSLKSKLFPLSEVSRPTGGKFAK
jgi:hypothetical protein